MKAVVALAGPIEDNALLRERVAEAALVIAADSGAERLLAVGMRPDTVIGDLDSIAAETLAQLRREGVEVAPHPAPEDKTDGHVALLLAQERGASEVLLLGAHGGERLDHAVTNLLFLVSDLALSTPITALYGWTEAVGLRATGARGERRAVTFSGDAGDYVSIIALSDAVRGVTTQGLRWPLREATLRLAGAAGMSNELNGSQGGVSIGEGVALATHTFRSRGP